MGMFDYVECAADLPGDFSIARGKFQTRSLYRVLGRFTITGEGRLLYYAARYETTGEANRLPRMIAIPDGDIDLNFHGDILLTAEEDEFREYVVRFTHGVVEWVRPFEEFSEAKRMLAIRRNLEDSLRCDLQTYKVAPKLKTIFVSAIS
jgi:hypothetical protein